MANEFERHVAMDRDEPEQSKASEMYSQAKDQVSGAARSAADTVRENPGTISSVAIIFGIAGFAIGFVCGQSSGRSRHHWY